MNILKKCQASIIECFDKFKMAAQKQFILKTVI